MDFSFTEEQLMLQDVARRIAQEKISTGAGANSRHAIGTGVIGGMLFATLLGLLMIPVFFVVVRRMLGDKLDEPSKEFMERQRDADAAHRPDR